MKKITCELCGSNDIIKEDGLFVCQSCGTKYSIEEARKLMIEGKVDVSGSTVHIDKTNEIENLLTIARRARDEGNNRSAANNYEEILKIDPDNWEANFYRSYCTILEGRIIDLSNNLKMVSNTALSTIKMLFNKDPINEAACTEIILRMTALLSIVMQNYYSLYLQNPEWVERSYDGNNFTHNKGNYMRLQDNIDSAISTVCVFYGGLAAIPKCSSALCLIMEGAVDTIKQELSSFPQNPFTNAGMVYRQFYNVLAARSNALFTKVNELKNLMKQIREKHEELEVELKRKEEERRKEEQKKKNAAYWAIHKEEKAKFDSMKKEMTQRIKHLESNMHPIEEKIQELTIRKNSEVPSQKEYNSIQFEINKLSAEKDKLVFFKRKEKQALQDRIDLLTPQMQQIQDQMTQERAILHEQIDKEIAPLREKLLPLENEKKTLMSKIAEIDNELTRDREFDSNSSTEQVRGLEFHGSDEEIKQYTFESKTDVDNDEMFVYASDMDIEETDDGAFSDTEKETDIENSVFNIAMLTDEERKYIRNLEKDRRSGKPQEDLFVEDMEHERNLKQLLELWDVYAFDEVYPSIGRVLREYREKEKGIIGGLPVENFKKIKQDLASIFMSGE